MTAPDVDLLAEEYAEQWPEDTDNDAAILARAYLQMRGERDEWRDVSVGPAYATLLTENLEAADARLAAVAAEVSHLTAVLGGARVVSYDGTENRMDDVLARLRAALTPDAAPSPGVEETRRIHFGYLPECPDGKECTRPGCLDAHVAPTPAAPTDEGARLGEGHSSAGTGHDSMTNAEQQEWHKQVLADRARGLGGDQQGGEAGR